MPDDRQGPHTCPPLPAFIGCHSCHRLDEERRELVAEVARLRAALRGLAVAQGRLLDRWADSDKALREELWRELHKWGDIAREALGAGGPTDE